MDLGSGKDEDMRTKLVLTTILATLASLCGLYADPIGPTNCTNDSCNGAIYTLSYDGSPLSATGTTQTFRITLTIDTSGVPSGETVNAVAVKVSSAVYATSILFFRAIQCVGLRNQQWNQFRWLLRERQRVCLR